MATQPDDPLFHPAMRSLQKAGMTMGGRSPLEELSLDQAEKAGGRQRLADFRHHYETYPGAAPGGSGLTGLQSNDAVGYSKMLNDNRLYEQLKQFYAPIEDAEKRTFYADQQRAPSINALAKKGGY